MSSRRTIDELDGGWDEFLAEAGPATPAAGSNGLCSFLQQTGFDHYIWWDRKKDVGLSDADYLEMFRALGPTKAQVSKKIGDHIMECPGCAEAFEKESDFYESLERRLKKVSER
ncbi:MAG: hypothetical protein KKD17_02120 [Nanoarchaeota archaeon]|nr:hypothetical protein [Nanoarchaeota archaeon]